MEQRYQHTVDGQEVEEDDLNLLAQGALMDDRVLADLLRIKPYNGSTIAKGILPFGTLSDTRATVRPNGATGTVMVMPFRAVVGSTVTAASNPLQNWREIRSGVFAVSTDGTNLGYRPPAFTANSSGNARWDLVYAAVTPATNSASVNRFVKDPLSGVPGSVSLVTSIVCAVTIGVQAGTASASPALPSLPADAGGTYYIPLAYVRIPNGFSSSSTILTKDIWGVAPVALPSSRNGGANASTPNNSWAPGGAPGGLGGMTTAKAASWGATGTRPPAFMPADACGIETLVLTIDMTDVSSTNWSHQPSCVLDSSRDWRRRYFRSSIFFGPYDIASDPAAASLGLPQRVIPYAKKTTSDGTQDISICMGQSFTNDANPTGTGGLVLYADGNSLGNLDPGTAIIIFCEASTGNLIFTVTGSVPPQGCAQIWIDAFGPFPNY